MQKREIILKALECLAQHHATCSCGECEYWDSRLGYDECERRMAPDIIALLKEQEEIVRCKDCWKRDSFDCPLHQGGYPYHDTEDDWFCGDGVAKDINVLD